MDNEKERLKAILIEKSYQKRKVVLTSGRESDFYIDCKQTTLSAEGAYLVGKVMFERIRKAPVKVQGVAGMTLGADPMVAAIAVASHIAGNPIHALIIRKEPKKHGTASWIEGKNNLPVGAAVTIVEDVVTTGGTLLKAIERAEAEGFKVVHVLALVDRNEGGRELLKEKGYDLEAVFTREDLVE
ncbi:MAG: orotate phosphoribosyltransferase [Desulfovibrionales bacterium]|nr:orotate phosphoribosyltransferase [Desulfovibrionales bacterium]